MKKLPHTKLNKHEFILLRSLAKQPWQSTDPVMWKKNRAWWVGHWRTGEARVAAESLLKRGLIDGKQLTGFSPLRPGEPVKQYQLNARGASLLSKANGYQSYSEVTTKLSTEKFQPARSRASFWERLLGFTRRQQVDSSQTQQSIQ